jgi:rhamnulokinase
MVGGGSRNELLCQLTADACGLPVLAGPAEATAIGNVLIQARTLGAVGPDLAALRSLVRRTQPVRRYEPRGDQGPWAAAAARLAA